MNSLWKSLVFICLLLAFDNVVGSMETPLCFDHGEGEKFCSNVTVEGGEVFSKLLNSMMQLQNDRSGRRQMNPSQAYNEAIPASSGAFQLNGKLDKDSKVVMPFLTGAESITKYGDFVYTAATDGIYKVNMKTEVYEKIFDASNDCGKSKPCSRPLGLRTNGSLLLCADALLGLVGVHLETGNISVLLPVGTVVDGEAVTFPDDLDVDWNKGFVYFSDGSTKWDLPFWMMALLENDHSGRIIRFNLNTGETVVFAKNIQFANGVQISHDKKSLLVSECSARRILQFNFDSSLPVTGKFFLNGTLPGHPDNIRPSKSGGYWVALAKGRINGERTLVDELKARPELSKRVGDWLLTTGELMEVLGKTADRKDLLHLGFEIKTGTVLLGAFPNIGIVVELNEDGGVVRTLDSSNYNAITEVNEQEEGLYLGSYVDLGVVYVPRSSLQ